MAEPQRALAHRKCNESAGRGYASDAAIRQVDAALEDGAPCPFWRVAGYLWGPDDTSVMHVDWQLRREPEEDRLKRALHALFEAQTGREPAQYGIEVTQEFDPRDWT